MRTCVDCGRPHRARGYCGSCYNRHYAKPSQALTPCTVCDTMVMKDKRDHTKRQPVCSDMCRTYLQRGHWPICELPPWPTSRRELALAKLATVALLPPSRKRWYAGRCVECGSTFIHNMPHTNTCSYGCSRRWQHRIDNTVRRMRVRGATVERFAPREIFERDGWRCQIPRCVFRSRLVARTKVVPDDRAAVLDHIIPLAAGVEAGGVHSRANTQCAHFRCNSIKRDNAADDQLLLFG